MDSKFWLNSTTVQATLAQVAPIIVLLLKAFNVQIGDAETSAIVNGIAAIWAMVAAVMAIIGRFKAKQPLTTQTDAGDI